MLTLIHLLKTIIVNEVVNLCQLFYIFCLG